MKSVMVNQPAEILTGRLKGFSGLVVGFDAVLDEVDIMLDEHCSVSTSSDNIQQGLDFCGKDMQCPKCRTKDLTNDGELFYERGEYVEGKGCEEEGNLPVFKCLNCATMFCIL